MNELSSDTTLFHSEGLRQKMVCDDIHNFLQLLNQPRVLVHNIIRRLYALIYKHSTHVIRTWFHPSTSGEPFLFRVVLTNNRNLEARIAVLTCLVRNFDFDINQKRRNDLSTVLHIAMWRNRTDLIPVLLQLGADPRVVNVYMETPNQSVNYRQQTDTLMFIHTSSCTTDNAQSPVLKELAVKLTDNKAQRVLYQQYFNFSDVLCNPEMYTINLNSVQSTILTHIKGNNFNVTSVGFHLHKHLPLIQLYLPLVYGEIHNEVMDVTTLISFLNTYMCSRYFRQKNKHNNMASLVLQGVNQAVKVTQRILEDFGSYKR